VIDLGPDGSHALVQYPWLEQHPHVRSGWDKLNAIFVAKKTLTLSNGSVPGFGVFDRPIMLTKDGAATPSEWAMPAWLDPTADGVGMTYHPPSRWLGNGILTAVARGQEFVADVGERMDAQDWLLSLFRR
jgi:hypothetical protein